MNFLQSAVLGLVQGLTEFIPVSSTGHLILARKLLGLELVGTLSFDAMLQLATVLAVIVYFWRDLWQIFQSIWKGNRTLLYSLIVGTIPAIILGLLIADYMDNNFRSVYVVAGSLITGSVLFYFAEGWYRRDLSRKQSQQDSSLEKVIGSPRVQPTTSAADGHSSLEKEESMTMPKAAVVGLFQCLALVPGFSRSGATISGGLITGLKREEAARFSFLLSIPIILGTGLKSVWDLQQSGNLVLIENSIIIAAIFAFLSGFLAIHFLIKFLKNHSLNWFGAYRIILALVILVFL